MLLLEKESKIGVQIFQASDDDELKEGELPAADSCAIMEGEDNEEEIMYSNKQSLLESSNL